MLSDFDGIALTSDKVPFCMLNEGPMKDVETDDCNMKFWTNSILIDKVKMVFFWIPRVQYFN